MDRCSEASDNMYSVLVCLLEGNTYENGTLAPQKTRGNTLSYDKMNCDQMKSVLSFWGKPFTSLMKKQDLLALVNIGPG